MSLTEVLGTTQVQRDTIGSILVGLIGQGTLIVSGVLSARILGVEDRGNLALILLFPVALSQLGSLGLPLSVTYSIAKDHSRTRNVVQSIAGLAVIQVILLVMLHALILAILASGKSADFRQAGLITLVIIPVALAQEYGLAILQGLGRFRPFNMLRLVLPSFYSAGVLVIFLLGRGNLIKVALVYVIAISLAGLASLIVALYRLPVSGTPIRAESRMELFRFGFKAFLGSISPVEMLQIDQAVVGLYLSPSALGLYVVGKAFTNLPRFIASSAGKVAYPYVANQQDRHKTHQTIWRFFWLVIGMSVLVVGGLEITAEWLVRVFFGDNFSGAVSITRILLISSFFLSARNMLADGVRGAGQPTLGTIAEIVSWFVLFPALAFMTPMWGADGAAGALSVSSTFSLIVLILLAMYKRIGNVQADRITSTRSS